jgi:hypothetical protein
MRMLRPSVQPNSCSLCTNAVMRAWPLGSSAGSVLKKRPMRRIPLARLRARPQRPAHRCVAEKRDEFAPLMCSAQRLLRCITDPTMTKLAGVIQWAFSVSCNPLWLARAASGQTEKASYRAILDRFTTESGRAFAPRRLAAQGQLRTFRSAKSQDAVWIYVPIDAGYCP